MDNPLTIISDIDGTLIKHQGDITQQHLVPAEVLPGVLEQFRQWDREKCKIFLITGRRESTRKATEKQLSEAGLFWDGILFGATNAPRMLINDRKPDSPDDTAFCMNLTRNQGFNQ